MGPRPPPAAPPPARMVGSANRKPDPSNCVACFTRAPPGRRAADRGAWQRRSGEDRPVGFVPRLPPPRPGTPLPLIPTRSAHGAGQAGARGSHPGADQADATQDRADSARPGRDEMPGQPANPCTASSNAGPWRRVNQGQARCDAPLREPDRAESGAPTGPIAHCGPPGPPAVFFRRIVQRRCGGSAGARWR